ncbi:uncharacterized protein PSFLO_01956 [Pseudozyma flocculosa]|uniref:Uncharacterized protein n=1 Tax=Pseudozyma flocculosa TaxID=84751 RepID=A0A5C3EXJ2_9BASI|nr:uncharacterized protein PSFLO_01956 [Pseudozyma flocculosa]
MQQIAGLSTSSRDTGKAITSLLQTLKDMLPVLHIMGIASGKRFPHLKLPHTLKELEGIIGRSFRIGGKDPELRDGEGTLVLAYYVSKLIMAQQAGAPQEQQAAIIKEFKAHREKAPERSKKVMPAIKTRTITGANKARVYTEVRLGNGNSMTFRQDGAAFHPLAVLLHADLLAAVKDADVCNIALVCFRADL